MPFWVWLLWISTRMSLLSGPILLKSLGSMFHKHKEIYMKQIDFPCLECGMDVAEAYIITVCLLLERNYSDYYLYLIEWRACSSVSLEYPFLWIPVYKPIKMSSRSLLGPMHRAQLLSSTKNNEVAIAQRLLCLGESHMSELGSAWRCQ